MTGQVVQERGTGRTTRQMREAPKGAVFIWCNRHLHYAVALAGSIGRNDLMVLGSEALEQVPHELQGREFPALVVDHALASGGLDRRQIAVYRTLLTQVRPRDNFTDTQGA